MSKQIIHKTKNSIQVGIEVLIGKEGKYFVVYCPALELSSYGKSEKEAIKNFETEVEIFIEETEKKGTLEKILLKLGWCLTHNPTPTYTPPKTPKYNQSINQPRSFTETVTLPI
jgi:predicted RNase H-like HicB family nuclease